MIPMSNTKKPKDFLRLAIAEARVGIRLGHGGPFGAVVVDARGRMVAKGHNTVLKDCDPTCHAEVQAMRAAAKKLGRPHLTGCTVYASSEPCPMCLTTSYWADVKEVVYAVPVAVAAEVGFADDFIYKDLARPMAKRRIKVRQGSGLVKEGREVFAEWKKRQGRLY